MCMQFTHLPFGPWMFFLYIPAVQGCICKTDWTQRRLFLSYKEGAESIPYLWEANVPPLRDSRPFCSHAPAWTDIYIKKVRGQRTAGGAKNCLAAIYSGYGCHFGGLSRFLKKPFIEERSFNGYNPYDLFIYSLFTAFLSFLGTIRAAYRSTKTKQPLWTNSEKQKQFRNRSEAQKQMAPSVRCCFV